MTITKENFDRINNDINGNPRYVTHYLNCEPESLKSAGIVGGYARTCKLMNTIGGRKYHNKSYGGGIVFQSYNLDRLCERIEQVKAEYDARV